MAADDEAKTLAKGVSFVWTSHGKPDQLSARRGSPAKK